MKDRCWNSDIRERPDDLAKAVPVIAVTLGLACFGLLLMRSGQWFARGDREYISNVIRTALGQEGRGRDKS